MLFVVLTLTTQSLTSSHAAAFVNTDVTLTFVVARVAEMSCALDVGFGDEILWNQVPTKH